MKKMPGYTGSILKINLSTKETQTIPTTAYSDRFVGGRGIAVKIHWDEVPGFAGSRWQISGKSPLSNQFSYCNLGGAWGTHLKFAGYDGLVIYGKSEKKFEIMKDEYYSLRNWDVATGLPSRSALEGLDLKEIADGLEKQEMLAP